MAELQKELHEIIVEDQNKIVDQLADTALQTEKRDNLSIFVNNIKIYSSIKIQKTLDQKQLSKLKFLLQSQISAIWFQQQPLKDFRLLIQKVTTTIEGYALYQNLQNFEQICRQLIKVRTQAENEQAYLRASTVLDSLFNEIAEIIADSQRMIQRLDSYDVYGGEGQSEEAGESIGYEGKENETLGKGHFEKQLITTKIDFPPTIFTWAQPLLQRTYISQASRAYNQICPFRIKSIIPHSTQTPTIHIPNYFTQNLQQSKSILAYCIPGTNKLGYYLMSDVCKLLSMDKEYYQERQLENQWVFSKWTKSVVTQDGRVFAINCRTTNQKIDTCMYEITQTKASNRGPLPFPKRQSSFIYLNGYLYVIGGYGQTQKCSKKNYRYSLRDKKWSTISQSYVALKKPTLCTLNNRYILKIGGLNQFDYINKVIEIYDPLSDKWSLVRATAKNIMQEIEILQDSLAVQINDDEVYVFGGKNNNKQLFTHQFYRYSVDKGFILQITEIKQRRKGASKVNGQLWNVSAGKRNLLTFFGAYSPGNVVVHFNCIYFLRVKYVQPLSV